MAAIECPTHSIIDAALRTLPVVLPVLDFSTIKNELFPVIASVFSKTTSLAIKVRGLQAFVILCGGSAEMAADDGLNGLAAENKKTSSSSALDKYTMQEKIVPLIKAIKTKEPAVMVAALNVLRIVGQVADADFVAMDILPILWSMSLGPLLDLKQFQTFMELIKNLSRRVEDEQTRKLQELSGSSNGAAPAIADDFLAFGGVTGTTFDQSNGATEDDFEALVKGKATTSPSAANSTFTSWSDSTSAQATASISRSAATTPQAPTFSWSTPSPSGTPKPPSQAGNLKAQQGISRTVTPDLGRFESLTPTSTQFSQPLQPAQSAFQPPPPQQKSPSTTSSSINWSTAAATPSNAWASSTPTTANYRPNATISPPMSATGFGGSMGSMNNSMSGMSLGQRPGALGTTGSTPSFSLPPPPAGSLSSMASSSSSFGIAPPPKQQSGWGSTGTVGQGSMGSMVNNNNAQNGGATMGGGQQKSGLDKYESLI